MQHTQEVCELFNVSVLSDMEALGNDENDNRFKPVIALGWNGEPGAGISYGTMTRWFSTEAELENFCERNIDRFRAVAQDDEAPAPDASDWQ